MSRNVPLLLLATAIILAASGLARVANPSSLELEPHDGGFFSINIPKGWQVITAGHCSMFAFVVRDPQNPLRQLFLFGEIGPVYLSEQQRQADYQYMSMGGFPVTWIDMPSVEPLTPANFLLKFSKIAASQTAQQFMPQCPRLNDFRVISESPQLPLVPGGQTALVRGVFGRNGKVGEGQFLATVARLSPTTGGPGVGIGFGFTIAGVTAPKREFPALQSILSESLRSYSVSRSYVANCLQMQAQTYAGIQRAGQTLRETSDMIVSGWHKRQRTHDILAEKRSDAILSKERLYDPDTGSVYQFKNGFYDDYNLHRERYEMNNLQPLPEDGYGLWMKPAKDGHLHLN